MSRFVGFYSAIRLNTLRPITWEKMKLILFVFATCIVLAVNCRPVEDGHQASHEAEATSEQPTTVRVSFQPELLHVS